VPAPLPVSIESSPDGALWAPDAPADVEPPPLADALLRLADAAHRLHCRLVLVTGYSELMLLRHHLDESDQRAARQIEAAAVDGVKVLRQIEELVFPMAPAQH
jgi:hypothetical protein